MTSRIDIENSIAQERMVYKQTMLQNLGRLLGTYFNVVGTLVFFYVFILLTVSTIETSILFSLVLTPFILINAYFIDKMYFITTPEAAIDIKLLENYLISAYKNIKIDSTGSNILIATTTHSFWAYKRVFTAVYDSNKIGLNLFVLGKGDTKYCLIALSNYFICKKILKKLYLSSQTKEIS
jgi:hypothetical protein